MANPLTLYVPIKQDFISQTAAKAAASGFVQSVKAGLDASAIVHYARLALIPNLNGNGIQAVLLVTTFDGPMNPYLKFFWDNPGTQKAFAGIAAIALNPPKPPVTNLSGFENFINKNNLNQPADLYQAYTKTVKQITASPATKSPVAKAGSSKKSVSSKGGSSKSSSSKSGSGKSGSSKGGSSKGGSGKGGSKR
jgi:uncharacterized membrane protein YgcG